MFEEKENQEKKPIAFVTYSETGDGNLYIAQMAVDEEYQRRGIGLFLTKSVVEKFLEKFDENALNEEKCLILTRNFNRPAIELYSKIEMAFANNDLISGQGYDPEKYIGKIAPIEQMRGKLGDLIKEKLENTKYSILQELEGVVDKSKFSTEEAKIREEAKENKTPSPITRSSSCDSLDNSSSQRRR